MLLSRWLEEGKIMKSIEVDDLVRNFKELRAVDQINFHVNQGEVFGFLGPNGAGKTTTIKMLTGQLRPTGGSAKVLGCDIVQERDKFKPRIGVVFEHHNTYKRLSGYDNLRFSARLYGTDKARVNQVKDLVGLSDQAGEQAKNYSNGMKQRLLIARELLHKPEIIFKDEPTKGLDPGAARAIRNFIYTLSEQGVTISLTTHYMEEADQLSNRVAILAKGNIVALDKPVNLKSKLEGKCTTLKDVFIKLTAKDFFH
jgi:ABC-2 type transport system ATP-binding protein